MLLGAFFGTSAEFWMNLQSSYALGSVGKKIKNKVKKIKPHSRQPEADAQNHVDIPFRHYLN